MIQEDVGWGMTFACRILLRSWLMMKKQYGMLTVIVGTVKKSMAATASGWFFKKASQRLSGSGSLGALRIHREMVRSEISQHRSESQRRPGPPNRVLRSDAMIGKHSPRSNLYRVRLRSRVRC